MSTFYGDSSKWLDFWNQFECTIHNNGNLSKTEKFTYLKSLLSGNALSAISGFVLSDRNYDSSIEILKDRFGRQDIVISSHMNKLLSIEPVRNISNVKALRKLFDECEIQIRSLESLNVTSGSYGNLLCPIILQKIPEELNFEFNRKEQSKFDITELIEFLRKEINCREAANLMNYSKTFQRQDNKKGGNQWNNSEFKPKIASASTLSTMNYKCIFCNKNHGKFKCEELDAEKKREFLKRNGRCFLCFGQRHLGIFCSNKHLSCKKCRGKPHHESICLKPKMPIPSEIPDQEESADISQNSSATTGSDVILQTVYAVGEGKRKNCILRCLLDGGSQVSFIREDISKKLGLPSKGYSNLNIHTFAEKNGKHWRQRKVELTLRNINDPDKFITLDVIEAPVITTAEIKPPDGKIKSQLKSLGISVMTHPSADQESISVLIGADCLWKIAKEEIKRINENAVALDTIFGWCIQGRFSLSELNSEESICSNLLVEEKLSRTLESFWNIESLGVNSPDERLENEEALRLFENSIQQNNDRYEVRLPWINENVILHDNYANAERRFFNLLKQFRSNLNFYKEYKQVINDQIKDGIVEKVDPNATRGERIYYIPHRAVLRKNHSSTKLRVVYDASSKDKNQKSLNDCLLQGPNLVPELLKVLLKFRLHRIVFTADIQKAFLQISVSCEDRDAMRFLWIHDDSNLSNPKVQIYRMCRVMFGAKSSPFLLSACIKHHLRKFESEYPKTVELLNNYMYVDDFICGTNTEMEAIEIYHNANTIMKKASMTLTKWNSNSPVLRKEYETDKHKDSTPLCDSSSKVLGLEWDTRKDVFSFSAQDIIDFIQENEQTKRCVLKAVSRIFDPLGFLAPYVIQAKVLFQDLWLTGIDWDKPIPVELQSKWIKWHEQLKELPKIQIPRWYFCTDVETSHEWELHCFNDSSQSAYGSVVYLKFSYLDETKTAFVISKSRVAPLKKLSLPRLELMAALLGARLIASIREHFANAKVYMWTDSKIVLHWIKNNPRRWKTFVQNRVAEIQEKTPPEVWNHCPGCENPADKITRGLSIKNLVNDQVWWHGPPWLIQQDTSCVSSYDDNDPDPLSIASEERIITLAASAESVEPVLDIQKFSNLHKLLRVTAYVLRFVTNLRSQEKTVGHLSTDELSSAMDYWIKLSQFQCFSNEINCIKCNKCIDKSSKLYGLNPKIDEKGLLRVKSRLVKSSLDVDEVNPIILPNDYFSRLIVLNSHERVLHSGVNETLIQTRAKFWILRARRFIKSILYGCRFCKKFNAYPGTEISAPLPPDRVEKSQPFEVSGIDFAGPLILRDGSKVYIALFTCAVTRGIHLELITSLSAECFIQAFRRFISRRGVCKIIYSDNAKTFKRADKELKYLYKLCKDENVSRFIVNNGITWKFIVEGAPWWGGFWERLVRSVKTCLKRILGKSSLTYEELYTVLVEIEAVINSRPITYLYSNVNEPDPLSPSHFLTGSKLTVLPSPNTVPKSSKCDLIKRWKHRLLLLDHFWKRFYKEYLLELRSAMFSKIPKNSGQFKINDVVLIREDNVKRCNWKLGKIKTLFPGRDGKIRSCEIQVANGTLRRPIERLYNLEVQD
uniref:Integrase catalytic domain-containing protein n=2 Tax=Araneus ventricosus TaxID=182803 RepID=A0A4Y2HZB1_ARAVE|nr:hypothetical protein AVEN_62568-1 [Araneus ventricosus]